MDYHFLEIEKYWQNFWQENQAFKAENNSEKPKFYVLDMFPYPSGAGLHVGHPLGYIASDIFSQYKRLKGFNVLHPMGYDSFGLPAEQYAIQTGQHPAVTTKVNIEGGTDKQGNLISGYENQLKRIGLSFDWSREIRTSDPNYYKWTQWIFIQLFNAYYDQDTQKAVAIEHLITRFENEGNSNVNATKDDKTPEFSAAEWAAFSDYQKSELLLNYRLAFLAEAEVNWCPALGTVLANDEVINGLSERGGHPVIRKKMTQWMMRITAYAERLLEDLNTIDWPEPIKDAQRNWIGKSKGASLQFDVQNHSDKIEVFTTRPDTVFGVTYVTLAPEHSLVQKITTADRKAAVDAYIEQTSKRSERERMADVTKVSGEFTGAFAIHPFTKELIPIWIGDYVLASYGTGAVMAVPAGDERDFKFAKHFQLPIVNIFKEKDISEAAFTEKGNFELINSSFLNDLDYAAATEKIILEAEKAGIGKGKINFRLRDAVFSRQRYWGEPVPIYFKNGIPEAIETAYLPLVLPEVDEYLPTETGEPPLGRAKNWAWDSVNKKVVANDLIDQQTIFPLELNTMPGWAGSSWYFLRYMDAHNEQEFASQEAIQYWKNVDLYLGGSEHATGHLLYSRFWQKFLFDKGLVPTQEYAQKLINQGMILGVSAFVYRIRTCITDNTPEIDNILPHDFVPSIFISNSIKNVIDEYNSNKSRITGELNAKYELVKKQLQEVAIQVKERIDPENRFTGKIDYLPNYEHHAIHVDVALLKDGDELDTEKLKAWRDEFANAEFILEDGKYITGREVEKMSKSKLNVLNPDEICNYYGADTLRLYEMFLGPIEQSKPWNTQGLSGVSSFLKKLWRLFHSGENGTFYLSEEKASKDAMKVLHQTIKKVDEDINNFSLNTSVSTFMIAVNEFTKIGCKNREALEPFLLLLYPYAPHISEELWKKAGKETSIAVTAKNTKEAIFPVFEASWLIEDNKEYPVSFNGKVRFKLDLPLTLSKEEIEKIALADEQTIKWLEGQPLKKIIVVPGKIINIVM